MSEEGTEYNLQTSAKLQEVPITESSEKENSQSDVTIVFGQGPIKPVMLYEELTPEQQQEWNNFSQDPLHSKEPEFRVIEGVYKKNLDEINEKDNLTQEEKRQLIEIKRNELQHNPRLALHRYGRIIALAAGSELLEGHTKSLILSGGKTLPGWSKENGNNPLPQKRLTTWPSEAELMRQQIIAVYGDRFQKKYNRRIEDVLHIEDSSPTTIHNFAFALEKYNDLITSSNKINFLSTDIHLPRVMALAELTVDTNTPQESIDAQHTLSNRAEARKKMIYKEIVDYTQDTENNPIALEKFKKEQNLFAELTDPKVLAFWEVGGKIKPELHETILRILGKGVGQGWEPQARTILEKYGLDYNTFSPDIIAKLDNNILSKLKQDIQQLNTQSTLQYNITGTSTGPIEKKDV
ncbi:MAG TPA: ElyC/SanA/YdcF family protein [Candidatus Woesebacteria bacterium]|nr:ElyC/SanA/YdcF family protein [Candidatus Woesebacteria bacterium]